MAQTTSDLWKEIRKKSNVKLEYRFKVSDGESESFYLDDSQEISHSVEYALYDEFGIGNTFCAKLSLEVFADNIPRSAKIERFVRIKSGEDVSEWLPKGIFFVNKRSDDDGDWTIEALDAMRKAEVVWTPDQSLEFPISMQQAAQIFSEIIGCELDERNQIDAELTLDYPANDYTVRQILGYIATANCGNWIISDAGKLLLIPAIPNSETWEVGLDLTELTDNGKYSPVSRVTISVDDDSVITAGDDTGMEIQAECPYATQEIVDGILQKLKGYQYWAFSSSDVNIDPSVELGDSISAGSIVSIIAKIDDDGSGYPAISAPGQVELNEEYPVVGGPITRAIRKLAKSQSLIEKNSEAIRLSVRSLEDSQTKQNSDMQALSDAVDASNSRYDSNIEGINDRLAEFELRIDSLNISFQDILDNGVDQVTTKTGYTFNADGLDIHRSGDEIHNVIDNTGMYVKRGSGDTEQIMLQANAAGVIATDLTARNYLIVGSHARFEDYNNGSDGKRTACFYLKGD